MATRENYPQHPEASTGRTWIRWGPVVAGAAIGIGVMVVLSSLFAAIGGEATVVADNLHWFALISGVVALFVAGLLAGMLSGVRGVGPGIFQGLTAWALILVVAIAFPFPVALGVLETFAQPAEELGTGVLWATFLTLVVGAVVAALGGLIGGLGGGGRKEPQGRPVGREYEYGRGAPEGAYTGQPQTGRPEYSEPTGGGTRQPAGASSRPSGRRGR